MRSKPWDYCLKLLIHANPQAFVNWLVAGAIFVRGRNVKPNCCDLEMDALLEVTLDEEALLLEIEFQSRNDSEMPDRLLRYNVLTKMEHKLPVHSYVIYLLEDGEIKQSPLNWATPIKSDVVQFQFENVEVAKLAPEDIVQVGDIGLLPLLPLTRGGATREIVEKMLTDLQGPEYKELALVGFTLAYLIFQRKCPENLDWLERSFNGMQDILQESQLYQKIMEEGEIKGREKTLRQTIVDLVQDHFPELEGLAARQVATVSNVARLRNFILRISRASDAKEAAGLLLDLPKEGHQEDE